MAKANATARLNNDAQPIPLTSSIGFRQGLEGSCIRRAELAYTDKHRRWVDFASGQSASKYSVVSVSFGAADVSEFQVTV